MKMVYYDYNIEIALNYGEITSIVIENPMLLESFVTSLYHSLNKKEDKIHVLENFEKIEYIKMTDVIFSPVELTYDKREVQKKLIQNILEEIDESELSYKFIEICSAFLENLDEMRMTFEYEIDFDENFEMRKLLQCFDIHLQEPEGNFVERFVEYISVMSKLMRKQIFILVGCSNYMNEKDYELLKKHVAYENIAVLQIEGRENTLRNATNRYIIDEDLCEI